MPQEKTKDLIMNIATAGVVVGVIVAAYSVFIAKKDTTVTTPVSSPVTSGAEVTVAISAEVASTVRNLNALRSSVASSTTIFLMPAFQNLRDFSMEVPVEEIGKTGARKNPFIPSAWKLKIKAAEEAASKKGGQGGGVITIQSVGGLSTTQAGTLISAVGGPQGL